MWLAIEKELSPSTQESISIWPMAMQLYSSCKKKKKYTVVGCFSDDLQVQHRFHVLHWWCVCSAFTTTFVVMAITSRKCWIVKEIDGSKRLVQELSSGKQQPWPILFCFCCCCEHQKCPPAVCFIPFITLPTLLHLYPLSGHLHRCLHPPTHLEQNFLFPSFS